MYRRFKEADELLSQVLIFFGLSLTFGFMISWKLIGEDTFDAEMIVYLSVGGIMFVLFLASLVLYFIGIKKPFIDVEIDFTLKQIRLFYGWVTYSFDDIKLYSFNKRHRQVRLMVKNTVVGFSIDQMKNQDEESMSEEVAMELSVNNLTVAPKVLYNYHFISSSIFFGLFLLYVIVYGKDMVPFLNWRYIPTYFVLGAVVLSIGISYFAHSFRLSRYYNNRLM